MIELAAASALLALVIATREAVAIVRSDAGTARMRGVAAAIREGASAFLRREYAAIAIVATALAIAIAVALETTLALGFVLGAGGSASAGLVGVMVSVRANVRTAAVAARGDFRGPCASRFARAASPASRSSGSRRSSSSAVTRCSTATCAAMAGVLVGASLISLFARVGGGIYTKGADVGADLVGKARDPDPQDVPRNPAVIADNVGDNVGDCAGMAADLFETFLVTGVAAMLLGYQIGHIRAVFPTRCSIPWRSARGASSRRSSAASRFACAAAARSRARCIAGSRSRSRSARSGCTCSIAGDARRPGRPGRDARGARRRRRADRRDLLLHVVAVSPGRARRRGRRGGRGASRHHRHRDRPALGVVAGVGDCRRHVARVLRDRLDHPRRRPGTRAVRPRPRHDQHARGHGDDRRRSTRSGRSPTTPAASPRWRGSAPRRPLASPTRLDAVGNTTKALTKGYAFGSAALAALTAVRGVHVRRGRSPRRGVGRAHAPPDAGRSAGRDRVVRRRAAAVRVQLVPDEGGRRRGARDRARGPAPVRRDPGARARLGAPDYGRCVALVTSTALRQLIAPAALAVLVPLAVGFALGPLALAGVLLGVVLSGFRSRSR